VINEVRIREPIVQGIFYPDTGEELERQVSKYLREAEEELVIQTGASAIISPHAGYPFCGRFIASAFLAAAQREIETVVILAPVHREPEDAIFLTESKYFATPMGRIEVDDDIASELEACSTRIYRNDIPHLEEHAIEVQLPFIQHLFPNARIVPILMGRATETNVRLLAKALDATFFETTDSTLFVVSSNLSNHTEGETASHSVGELLRLIEHGDWEGLVSAYRRRDITACGAGCIAALFCRSHITEIPRLLSKTPPEIETDDIGHVIHFGAIALYPDAGSEPQ
jgi:AmmeMemoRadiSam system protein B